MIINGGSRGKWKRFAVHLANEKDNEQVRLVEVRGMSAKTIKDGFSQLQAMADMSGAGEKEFYYHANINPKEGEHLAEAQWEHAGEQLRESLRLEGQPGMTIEHTKDGRTHRHYISLRVDLETGRLISDSHDYIKHQKTARELEREFALEPVRGVHAGREGPRPERRPEKWEVQRGKRSGIDPQEVTREVTQLWHETDSGKAFRVALAQRGYGLVQGDRRDFCIIDPAGNEHSLARRIQGAKAKDIRERLADIDRDSLPKVSRGRNERRADKRLVAAAVDAGADQRRVERVINASRASHAGREDDGAEETGERRRRRTAYAEALPTSREKETPSEPVPATSWQQRKTVKRERESPEMER